jgi:MerR family transcriptional regulator, copper efflux regulator
MERTLDYSRRVDTGERRAAAAAVRQLKIGEVSKSSGIGIETLRFYEKIGLLERPGRTYAGYRLYDESVLERLAFIKRAQILGFSLDEIKQLIAHKSAGENPCGQVREIVRERLAELDQRIEQMKLYRDELATALIEWDEIGEQEGHVCGLIENAHLDSNFKHKNIKGKK